MTVSQESHEDTCELQIVKALECREHRKVCHSQYMAFFCLITFSNFHLCTFLSMWSTFGTESIGPSPVIIYTVVCFAKMCIKGVHIVKFTTLFQARQNIPRLARQNVPELLTLVNFDVHQP